MHKTGHVFTYMTCGKSDISVHRDWVVRMAQNISATEMKGLKLTRITVKHILSHFMVLLVQLI